MMDSHLEIELEKKYLKAQRLKSVKELEKEYSKELISLYREKMDNAKKEDEFRSVIEVYKGKLQEIEFLKNKKSEIFEKFQKNSEEVEKNNAMLEEYLKEVERKKIEFNKFMKEKGKEALNYFKKGQQLKEKLNEELHRFEDKKMAKEKAIKVAKSTVENFKEKENERKEREKIEEGNLNYIYKINQTFHNMGNKIDFSTTRFHNVMIVKHNEDSDNPMLHFIAPSAHEKAEKETEKLKQRRKSKEQTMRKFENDTKFNSKEILRREKAKENLQRLESELNQLNQARKKSKNKMLPGETMTAQAKRMEKKSEFMMKNILRQKMGNRRGIFNKKEIDLKVVKGDDEDNQVDEEEVNEFYKDEESEKQEDSQDYINKLILEHNEKIDNQREGTSQKKSSLNKHYEEPLCREVIVNEEIPRLNPVDLESFNIGICKSDKFSHLNDAKLLTHKNGIVSGLKNHNSSVSNNNYKDSLVDYDISHITRPTQNKIVDSSIKQKATSLVSQFLTDLDKTPMPENLGYKEKPYLYVEPKLNMNIKEKVTDENVNNIMSKNINVSLNTTQKIKTKETTHLEENLEENTLPENEFQRDESKWKFSKQELLERRKKLLKDKTSLKKDKK